MSRKMMLVTFMVLPFLAARPVLAQDTLKLDLGKALEIALSENPTVKVADKKKYRRKSTHVKARALLYFRRSVLRGLQPNALKKQGDVYGFRHG